MKPHKNKTINRDLQTKNWHLTLEGQALVSQSQSQLLQLQIELSGLSALFKNMGDCELTSDELHGIGLSLESIAERVSASLTGLSGAVTSKS